MTPENTKVQNDGRVRCRKCLAEYGRTSHARAKYPCPQCGAPTTKGYPRCQRCRTQPIEERFLNYVEKTEDCWLWTGNRDRKGYGRFTTTQSTSDRAHRVAYRLWVGPIPDGHELHHTCKNRACVRPDHLRPEFGTDHARHHRRERPLLTHCKRGHAFTPENTRLNGQGNRVCRTCERTRPR
jgi:hypothetical protein